MRFRYRSEEEMKDSGVEWIGKIPKEWGLCNVKNIVKVKDGTHDTPKYVAQSTDARPLVTSKDVKNGKIDLSEAKYISYDDYVLINTRSDVKKGDVIMPMIGTVGNPTIVDIGDEFSIKNVALFKTCDNKNLSKFITYVFESIVIKEQLKLLTRGGVQNFASLSMLQNLKLVKIPNKDLNITLSFLDEKISRFNTIISKKEALIKTLEEAKKSLISEVVTGKVKVVKICDGYELVEREKEEMKDSGVEFIGQIPIEWSFSKFKHVCKQIIDGAHLTPNYIDKGVPFLRVTDITNDSKKINLEQTKYISEEEHKELIKRCYPKKGDLLLSKNGTIGVTKVIDWDWEFSIFVSLCLIKVKDRISVDLLRLFFESNILDEQIAIGGKKTSITNLHLEKIREFQVVIPPYDEQENIIDYLDGESEKINKLITKTKHQIQKLKEAKQSLISEAVTGKIEILD